jgi:hypothetical protein
MDHLADVKRMVAGRQSPGPRYGDIVQGISPGGCLYRFQCGPLACLFIFFNPEVETTRKFL